MRKKAFIILIFCLFFIGISAGYASNVTDYSSNLGENNIESNNIQDIVQENVNNLSGTNERYKQG